MNVNAVVDGLVKVLMSGTMVVGAGYLFGIGVCFAFKHVVGCNFVKVGIEMHVKNSGEPPDGGPGPTDGLRGYYR
jgi:hypothetical protein